MQILLATVDGGEKPPPRYRSHKKVWALKITDVGPLANGGATLSAEGFLPIMVAADVVRRYMPIAGDYLVIYEPDGYRAISPAVQFEDGYTRIA